MDQSLIQKKILHPGKGEGNFANGTKVTFHVKAETVGDDPKLIDDSKNWNKPVELLLGKKFKLEVWEACIRTMLPGETASFSIDKKLVSQYPIVSKTLRDAYVKTDAEKKEKKPHHCCGMGFKEGLGYPDLDELVNHPRDIKFTIELLKAEGCGSYEQEFWAMTDDEKLASIPLLREAGNGFYKEGNHEQACKQYSEAIGRLEQLMLREKPNDEDWLKLNEMKMPLLLNYSQCQLLQGEYYSVIEHCTTVLSSDPDNVKALFRRGKAYVKVFSPAEARSDLDKAASLDSSIAPGCRKLLSELAHMEKEKTEHDKN
ncbi:Aryl-hydrocarbon-interacting protein-like 1, partial [Halocaridina rubra]